jgi:hypothetical protein
MTSHGQIGVHESWRYQRMTVTHPLAHTGLVKTLAGLSFSFAALAGGVLVVGMPFAGLGVAFSGLTLGCAGCTLNYRDLNWRRCPDDDSFQSRSAALEWAMFVNLAEFLYLGLALVLARDLNLR